MSGVPRGPVNPVRAAFQRVLDLQSRLDAAKRDLASGAGKNSEDKK